MILGDILQGVFGEKGIAGEVVDVLKSSGVIKDPDMELKIRQALQDYELKKSQQDVDLSKIAADDRKSARDMNITSLQQDDKFVKRFIYMYASITTFVTFLYIFLVTFWTIPETNVRFADTVLGFFLGTLLATIITFFFGSSSSSLAKTQVIDKLVRGK
ncbi:MAG: hypothetical protein UX37_C0016G0007 [Microgenomates group bacterium GW2011_GWA2_46_16]|nr:MAG: hypothetical protein UX37_C0016G0007 [Microgenomates group bacterium GW2011_GWA2_46_16]